MKDTFPGRKNTLVIPNLKSSSSIPIARNKALQNVRGSNLASFGGRNDLYLCMVQEKITTWEILKIKSRISQLIDYLLGMQVKKRCTGWESFLHQLQDGHHTSALQLTQDLCSFEIFTFHLVIWFNATYEVGSLKHQSTLLTRRKFYIVLSTI